MRWAACALLAGAACYHGPEDIPRHKTAPQITRTTGPTGPCADTAYQRMKRSPVDSLSQREFEIFRMREAACLQFQVGGREVTRNP